MPILSLLTSWTMWQYAPDRNAVFDAPSWSVAWRTDFLPDCAMSATRCNEGPVFVPAEINGGISIVGTTLYVESYDRRLYALDAMTGRVLWSAPLPNIAMNTPLVDDGIVVAGTGGGAGYTYVLDTTGTPALRRVQGDGIYAFNAQTGAVAWSFPTAGENMPTGVMAGDASPELIVTNGDDLASFIDVTRGSPLLSVRTPGGGIMSSLAESNGIVYGSTGFGWGSPILAQAFAAHDLSLVAESGWTWAMRASDGQLLWTAPYGNGHGSPVVADGIVFEESTIPASWTDIGIWRSQVAALDANTGRLLWSYVTAPGRAKSRGANNDAIGGVYEGGALYQTLPYAHAFAAFDGPSGRVIWNLPTHGVVKMSAVVASGRLYFGDSDGYLYVVDARTGNVEESLHFPSIFACSSPVIVGGTLFIANGSAVYALKLSDIDRGVIAFANGQSP